MSVQGVYVKAAPFAELATRFAAVGAAAFPNENLSFDATSSVSGIAIRVQPTPGNSLEAKVTEAVGDFTAPYLACVGANLRFPGTQPQRSVNYKSEDGVVGEFNFEHFDASAAQGALEALGMQFTLNSYGALLRGRAPEAERAALQYREQTLADIVLNLPWQIEN